MEELAREIKELAWMLVNMEVPRETDQEWNLGLFTVVISALVSAGEEWKVQSDLS